MKVTKTNEAYAMQCTRDEIEMISLTISLVEDACRKNADAENDVLCDVLQDFRSQIAEALYAGGQG